jgi:HSP20 family protein
MTGRTNPFPEIEQLFEQFPQIGTTFAGRVPVDLIDAGDELLVYADLPGRDPNSITVQLEDDRHLQIEADPLESDTTGRYVTRERTTEAVSRTVTLPAAIDEARTEANYEQGVLTVHLPKHTGDSKRANIPVN